MSLPQKILVESGGLQLSQKRNQLLTAEGTLKRKFEVIQGAYKMQKQTRPNMNKLIKFHPTEDVMLKNLNNEVTIVLKSVGLEHDQKLEAPASLSSISLALDYCAWRVSSTLALQEYSILD